MKNFIRKLKYFSIFKRSFSFIFALIILSSFVLCQFSVASVSAAEIGAVESVAVTVGTLYSAVKSGEASSLVMDFFKRAVVFASEIRTNYFMSSDTIDTFYDNYMLSLDSKIDSGDLVEADIGNIRYVGGIPVSFDCPTLGCYCFFCNQAIADRIDAYTGQKNISVVASIVDGYWDQEFYRIRRPNFVSIVSNPDNWRCSFDSSSIGVDGSTNVNVIYQSFFDTFGVLQSDPSSLFYDTGQYGIIRFSGRDYPQSIPVDSISNYTDFIVIKYEAAYPPYPVQYMRFYAHFVSDADPHIYKSIAGTWGRLSDYEGFSATEGIKEISLSRERAESLGLTFSYATPIDITDIFPNWDELIEGGQVGVLDPTRGWWRARDFEDAIDLVGDAAAEAVQAGTTDVPLDIPDYVDVEDLPITDWSDTEDFVDTTGVVAVDDDTPFPDVPVNPDPEDPENPERPELILPVLGSLFPFCIPVDIYNTFRVLNTSVAQPIWDIPLNVSIQGRELTNTTLHIDLTSNGLDALFTSLRVVQILVFIVGLGMFTKRFIF